MRFEELYKECYTIRCFEERVEKEFEKGKMRGTTHGCVGQEIIPVLTMSFINRNTDYITGTHRCHGQVLAYTRNLYGLACEMMGKKDGFNCGMGGSQHIKTDHFITNGVTGGMVTIGTGMALSLIKNGKKGVVVSFLGDGGFQEGYVQESLNLAQVYGVPILYILENNRYAMSTPTAEYTAGSIRERVQALHMAYAAADVREIEELSDKMERAFRFVREEQRPFFLEVSTFRLCGHSKSDNREYISDSEQKSDQMEDPIVKLRAKLEDSLAVQIEEAVEKKIDDVFCRTEAARQIDYYEYRKEKINGNILTQF